MKKLQSIGENIGPLMGLHRSDSRYANVLAANVAKVVSIPAGAEFVLFSATMNFWANFDAAAEIPTAEVTGTASILNPGLVAIDGAKTIGLVSSMAGIVGMEFFS